MSRGRGWWPWLLALGAIAAIAVGGWFLYDRVQDEIDSSKPVAVNDYRGIQETLAVDNITKDGFEPRVTREPNEEIAEGYVFEQQPEPGTRLAKGSLDHDLRLDRQA